MRGPGIEPRRGFGGLHNCQSKEKSLFRLVINQFPADQELHVDVLHTLDSILHAILVSVNGEEFLPHATLMIIFARSV